MKPIILYPCEYGNINKIDEDYKFEQEVAKEQGLLTYLFNYDNFILGEKLKLNFDRANKNNIYTAVYRGWMMNLEQYTRFYNELNQIGIKLITTPEEYEATHYFIKSYSRLMNHTPKTIWFKDGERIKWDKVRSELSDKFIVKDYVKSVKGFDFPEYLEASMTDNELNKYVEKFKQLRGDLYSGGIVLKDYVELDKSGEHTHEYRAFYINGGCRLMYNNSDNTEDLIPYHAANEYDLTCLHSPFYTVDFARLKNGEYTVIEIGDGQVSGIPGNYEAEMLYKALINL